MGKRSTFERRANDAYQSPRSVVPPLLPFLAGVQSFAEPCLGDGQLRQWLVEAGLRCSYAADITTGRDALTCGILPDVACDAIITNPPWTREILHPMIDRFMRIAPTWLLFDADWAHTTQRTKPDVHPKTPELLRHCSHIVSVGRVKWIENSKHNAKDNAAWYRFDVRHTEGPRFYGIAA